MSCQRIALCLVTSRPARWAFFWPWCCNTSFSPDNLVFKYSIDDSCRIMVRILNRTMMMKRWQPKMANSQWLFSLARLNKKEEKTQLNLTVFVDIFNGRLVSDYSQGLANSNCRLLTVINGCLTVLMTLFSVFVCWISFFDENKRDL